MSVNLESPQKPRNPPTDLFDAQTQRGLKGSTFAVEQIERHPLKAQNTKRHNTVASIHLKMKMCLTN